MVKNTEQFLLLNEKGVALKNRFIEFIKEN